MSISSLERGLLTRLWVIGIPLYAREPFKDLVLKWLKCSGEEWTVKRLKALKVDLFRMKAGLPPLTWVRKNRDGKWRGVLGSLFRWASRSDENFRKVVQVLMCYTVFQHSKPSASQVKKFTSALAADPPQISEEWLADFGKSVNRGARRLPVDRDELNSLVVYRGSPSKRKPSVGLRSVAQDSNILDDLWLFESDWGDYLRRKYHGLFEPVLRGLDHRPVQTPFGGFANDCDPTQIIGGKIAFIQEPGLKLRSVASPFLVYQLALRPFGKAVYRLARRLPWDCTHEQGKPILTLQDHLRKGKTVHSVDLSSATDYFPLEVQVKAMRSLFGSIPDIDLFQALSQATWISPIGPVRWRRGQPLGLFPSFAVFTVTHGMLLKHLLHGHYKGQFFVLGDDVVILDDKLYDKYIKCLSDWCCPYSPDKSISSNQICEFGGKIITTNSVTSQLKWRELSNDNFVDICRQLGKRSRVLLTRRQREVYDVIKHCSLPLGLNQSYPGSNLVAMEELSARTFGSRGKQPLDSLVDLAGIANRNLSVSGMHTGRLLSPIETTSSLKEAIVEAFVEKADQVLGKLLPWYTSARRSDLTSVPEAMGNHELPVAVLEPSRITALDRYRRLLGL